MCRENKHKKWGCLGFFQVPATFALHDKSILRENNVENTLENKILVKIFTRFFFVVLTQILFSPFADMQQNITGFESGGLFVQ